MNSELTDYEAMTKEQLIAECKRRELVTHDIWNAITSNFGPVGFTKILAHLEARKLRRSSYETNIQETPAQ